MPRSPWRRRSARSATVQGDLADICGIDDLFARARAAAGGPIEALVNNASAFAYDTPPDLDIDLLARLYAIGHAAPALLASALARQDDMADGAVVNILDQKIANLNPDFYAYTAGKLALAGGDDNAGTGAGAAHPRQRGRARTIAAER